MDASEMNQIEFRLLMQKNAKDFAQKAKVKEAQFSPAKAMRSGSSSKFESLAGGQEEEEEEKNMLDLPDSSDETPPFTLKSQFLKNLSMDKSKSHENMPISNNNNNGSAGREVREMSEFLIKNIDTGESYDIRNLDIVNSLTSQPKQPGDVNKEKAWQDYWSGQTHP